jgi:hypothetical protein
VGCGGGLRDSLAALGGVARVCLARWGISAILRRDVDQERREAMIVALIDEVIRQFFRVISGQSNMAQARRAVKRRMSREATRGVRNSARKALTDRARRNDEVEEEE